jgi:hypothetical protein
MSTPNRTLKIPQSPWSLVFRRLVLELETDPEFKRVVPATHLRSWSGVTADKAPLTPTLGRPVVRLTPQPANVAWSDETTQTGALGILVEIAVLSLCIDDAIDLWDLLVEALSPCLGTLRADLVAAGAANGEPVFSSPAFDARPDAEPEGYFYATGKFQIDVDRYHGD